MDNRMLVGADFLRNASIILDMGSSTWYFREDTHTTYEFLDDPTVASFHVELREDEGSGLDEEQRGSLLKLLSNYSTTFARRGAPTPSAEHCIVVKETQKPIAVTPNRHADPKKKILLPLYLQLVPHFSENSKRQLETEADELLKRVRSIEHPRIKIKSCDKPEEIDGKTTQSLSRQPRGIDGKVSRFGNDPVHRRRRNPPDDSEEEKRKAQEVWSWSLPEGGCKNQRGRVVTPGLFTAPIIVRNVVVARQHQQVVMGHAQVVYLPSSPFIIIKKSRTKETELVRYLGIKSVRLQEAL
ncbi:hypothetical protein NQ318_003111 [Aromia moschata]|uniref:Uncharacterized protein n=1 Tax=Aromia moschata TaxID=1265417 RepID=A0AAV8YV13_9CUCU|nr:hypothetical protein NQ318_003111 [Aromia moschata]